MGRRKKQEKEVESSLENVSSISGDVKRGIVAIFLFALAVLFILSFLSEAKILDAGSLGKYLNLIAGFLFGVGKYVSPLILVLIGAILLFRKEKGFYIVKILGLFVAFISILGFIHIVSYNLDEMLDVAKQGKGGGFLGYILGYTMLKMAGVIGGSVILVAFTLIGSVVAFNVSIVNVVEKYILGIFRKKDQEDSEDEDSVNKISVDGIEKNEDPIIQYKEKEEKVPQFVHAPNENEENEEIKIKESTLQKVAAWIPKKQKKNIIKEDTQWVLPPIDLLEREAGESEAGDTEKNAQVIQNTFRNFGIDVEQGKIQTGPTVTQYSFRPGVGVKLSKITSLNDNLALALASHPIRIEAPIPGKSLIGIEVKNKKPAKVRMPELLESPEFENRDTNMLLAIGKDVSGDPIFADLKKMPHLLIAGTTGSGKSICINSILLSLLYQNSPEDLKLILVDPKRVELSMYNGIPHLLADVIVENSKVVGALKWALGEMERRYKLLPDVGSKDIASFNKKAEMGEKRIIKDKETGETRQEDIEKLPFIVIVIDELADLMQSHGKEVEGAIIRLAQMSRAVGIHLIVSTQKPVVTVITGLIKSNIPTRIAFKVPSLMDSRTILDASGAEKLIGFGDMLFSSTTSSSMVGIRRIQGVYVSEAETKRVVDFVCGQKKEKMEESLDDDINLSEFEEKNPTKNGEVTTSYTGERLDFSKVVSSQDDEDEPLYEEAKQIVIEAQKASTSYLQRRLKLGYNRAARIIDILEKNGVVSEADGAKPRDVLVGKKDSPTYEDEISDQTQRDKWQM
jgi:S-DNA-T family DNA segregation ATPase FtsK/SpoIIIE